jgi:glycosyltransferase involved in cell wall biosynthesis
VQQRELCQDFHIAPLEKLRIIPLGLDLDGFVTGQESKRKKFREEFGLADDCIAIGIIGRLVPVKNHIFFLQGLQKVLAGTGRPVKAFIIGDGESRKSIELEASGLGISFTTQLQNKHPHPLVFTSWRTDVDTVCAGLDIIALTSLNEGTPVSLIEAQAAGKPVVSTRVGGISDVVQEGKSALLSEIGEVEEFGNNLLRLVNDDALRLAFSQTGRDFVLQKFGYKRLVKDMSELYYELLDRKTAKHY